MIIVIIVINYCMIIINTILNNRPTLVQRQLNEVDCGCFAIAWALHLAIGEKPESITLNAKMLRPHLIDCFRKKALLPFARAIKKIPRTRYKTVVLVRLYYILLSEIYIFYLMKFTPQPFSSYHSNI